MFMFVYVFCFSWEHERNPVLFISFPLIKLNKEQIVNVSQIGKIT